MKSVKNLLVPFVIMIALIIGVAVYYAVDKIRNNEISETSYSDGFDILYFNQTDLSSISVYNRETGKTSIVSFMADGNNNIVFGYSGDDSDPAVKYSQYRLSNYVNALTGYYGYSIVSKTGNYADYGLDQPAFTITINTLNGSMTKVFLGNKSPDNNYCYMFVEGSKDIYLVSSDKYAEAEKTAINFLDTTVLKIENSELDTVHFDRKSDGLSIDAKVSLSVNGEVSMNVFKPYEHKTSAYFINMINKVTNLDISEYVETDEKGLAKYGLDDPEYHFILTLKNGEKKELFFSKEINGYYYGYIAGAENCFMLNNYQLENLDMMETVLIDPYVCYFYADEFSSITGTYGDLSFKFSLDVPEGMNILSDKARVELDGRNAKITDSAGRSYASVLYESIANIQIGGIDTSAVVNTSQGPALSLSFTGKNYVTTEYDFYTRDEDSYYVFKDGVYMNFYVYSREIFFDGGNDTYSYGYWNAYELLNEAIYGNIGGIYDLP